MDRLAIERLRVIHGRLFDGPQRGCWSSIHCESRLMRSVDLSAEVTFGTLPTTMVSGDAGRAAVTITNNGDEAARSRIPSDLLLRQANGIDADKQLESSPAPRSVRMARPVVPTPRRIPLGPVLSVELP